MDLDRPVKTLIGICFNLLVVFVKDCCRLAKKSLLMEVTEERLC